MPRSADETSSRLELRIPADDKAVIARAAALEHMDLTSFVLRTILPRARAVISRTERIKLSERDTLMVLDLLENPPPPTDRLIRAAKAGKTLR